MKHNFGDNLAYYKAIIVDNNRSQRLDIDYDGIFKPMVKHSTIRIVLSLVVSQNWHVRQLDVKNAFIYDHL